jgi:TRAP-type transport system periplasmic protein
MLKKMTFLLPVLILALTIGGCGSGQEKAPPKGEGKVTFKLASLTAMDHTYNQGAAKFAELVKERSKGKIEITIYPNGQLGKGERELLEAIQQGTIDFYVGSTGPVGGFSPSIGILDLPFLFRDYAHVDKVLDGPLGRQLLDDLGKANLKGLAFWENGFRNLTNSKKNVKAPADAKGLKIRTMENKIHLAAWKAVGVNPVPMAYGEVYGALQQKTIDGQENPVAVIYTSKLNEVQKYLSLTQHVYSPALIVVSPKTWQALAKEDQDMMLKTAQEVAPYQRKLGRDNEEKQIAELAAKGMTVTRDINKGSWYKLMEGAMGEFIQSFGKDKVDAIINTK